jgi:hypothetical protein
VKEWFFVRVESDSLMAEEPTDIEKITCSASKIENAQRWGAIEPEILRALHINADPISSVLVRVDPSRVRPVRIMLPQPFQFGPIKGTKNASRTDRMSPATSVFPQALCSIEGKQFLEFARNSHREIML